MDFKNMDNKTKKLVSEMVDKFENDMLKTGKSDVKCPLCKTKLKKQGTNKSYCIKCETKDCFVYNVRGI